MKHSPLEPVAFLKVTYKNDGEKILKYGSNAAAMEAMQYLVGHPKVEHVQAMGVSDAVV